MLESVVVDLRSIIQATGPFDALAYVPTFVDRSAIGWVARKLADDTQLPLMPLLKRRHSFEYQVAPVDERRRASEGLFSYPGPALDGQRVALLDDCYVTGVTAAEVGRLLERAGACDVVVHAALVVTCPDPGAEAAVEMTLWQTLGRKGLIGLIESPDYVFTSFLITLLARLPLSQAKETVHRLPCAVQRRIGATVRAFPPGTPLSSSFLRRL
ncbi:MAG: ComF family protein [Egibacteraceae bacterium]